MKKLYKYCIIILAVILFSCKAQKEIQVERIEVPVVVTQEHTVENLRIDHVRDTLIQRDSVFIFQKGDTVKIEKWHFVQGNTNVVRVDTLRVYDSIPVPVTTEKIITKTVEIERKRKWWEKTLILIGSLSLILCGLGIAWKIGKTKIL